MSVDHKPNVLSEKHRILKAGSVITAEGRIDGNLNLSRAIGDLAYKKRPKLKQTEQAIISLPDIKKFEMTKDIEFAVIGCDGVFERKANQQIIDYINIQRKKKIKLSKICENLLGTLISPNVQRSGKIN